MSFKESIEKLKTNEDIQVTEAINEDITVIAFEAKSWHPWLPTICFKIINDEAVACKGICNSEQVQVDLNQIEAKIVADDFFRKGSELITELACEKNMEY